MTGWRSLARCAAAAIVAGGALTEPSAAMNVSVLTFLQLSPASPSNQEFYFSHAYRMAFVEVVSGVQFVNLTVEQGEELVQRFVVSGSGGLELAATLPMPPPTNEVTITMKMIDVSGFGSNREKMHAIMNETYEEHIAAGNEVVLVGGYSSSREPIKAEWAKARNVPFVSAGAAASSIFLDNDMAFGILSPITELAESTMVFLEGELGTALPSTLNVALLYEDVEHGWEYRDEVVRYAQASGGKFKVVFNEPFPYNVFTDPDNFTAQVERMRTTVGLGEGTGPNAAQALLVDAHSRDFILLHRKLAEYNLAYKTITYGARGTDVADVAEILRFVPSEWQFKVKLSLENVFAGLWWSPGDASESSRAFVTGWRKHEALLWVETLDGLSREELVTGGLASVFRKPDEQLAPAWFGATGYEAMRVMLLAVQAAASAPADGWTKDVVAALNATDVPSILPEGSIRFDANGQTYGLSSMAQNQFVSETNAVVDDHDHLGGSDSEDDGNALEVAAPTAASEFHPFVVYPINAEHHFHAFNPFTSPRPTCSARYQEWTVSACRADNTRSITFVWLDADGERCLSNDASCFCNDTKVKLPPEAAATCEFLVSGSGEAAAATALAWIGTTVAVILVMLLAFNWNNAEFKGGQRGYLLAIAAACMWAFLSILPLVGSNTEETCTVRVWNTLLAVGACLSLLLGRVLYWYRIWVNPSVETLFVPFRRLLVAPLISFAVCIIVVVSWLVTQDTFSMETTLAASGVTYNATVCLIDSSEAAPIVAGVYFIMAIFISVLFAYQTKDCDGRFFESWYLWIAAFNITFVVIILAVLLLLVDLSAVLNMLLISIALFCSAMGLLLCSFFPRLSAAYGIALFGRVARSQGVNTGAQSTDSNNVVQKYIHGRAKRPTSQATDYNN